MNVMVSNNTSGRRLLMSNREDIINIKNNYTEGVNIPIVPIIHTNLEKYSERTSYSKLMLNDFDGIHSVVPDGNNKYIIHDNNNMENPYYLQEMNGSNDRFRFDCYLGNIHHFRWFALYRPHKMMVVIVVADLLQGEKHPYRFYNDVYRKVEYYSSGGFNVTESERNHEQSIHYGLLSGYKTGLHRLAKRWRGQRYLHFANNSANHLINYRDYSDIYHFNDSFFFVGSRGQMFQLAFTMVDRKMDRVCKHRIISRHYYDKMKHLNSGIIPDNMKENTGQFSINVAGVEIPIIDRIDDDDFMFYKHNFDKHEGTVKEKLSIE